MTLRQNIVVTGMGIVSPIGIGKDPFWSALREGRSGIRHLQSVEGLTPAMIGAPVADFDAKQYVRPRKSLKVMSREIQLGFAAADLALADSGLRDKPADPERMGVIFGASLLSCELEDVVGVYRGCTKGGQFDFTCWGTSAMSEMFPLWMLKYLPNMPACHIGIAQDARGPNNTITLGDVSSLSAVAETVRVLERGQADAIIVGGVGSLLHPAMWIRSHMQGLSPRSEPPAAVVRPFDARRDGLVDGEGSAAFVTETEGHAIARGATIVARVLGYGAAFEPCRNGAPRQGTAIRRAIASALHDAGQTPKDIGVVVAHGLGTVEDDRIEAAAICETVGDVPVTAPKSLFGYLGPASGILETATAIMALQQGEVPPTLNYEQADPQCPVNVVHGAAAPLRASTALILSHSPQGQAVAVVLAKA